MSSYGILKYSAAQVGLPGDPNRIVNVYRPEEEVKDPDYIESLKNIPLIIDHEMLSGADDSDGTAPEEKGLDGVLTGNVYYDAPWTRGDVKVYTRRAQKVINDKTRADLSLGYGCEFEHTAGIFQGEPYEVVQRKMRGNHLALVKAGRVPGARVLDGLVFDHLDFNLVNTGDSDMKFRNQKTVDNAVEQLKALLPALQQFLNEEATEPAHQDNGGAAEGANPEGTAAPVDAGAGATAEGATGETGEGSTGAAATAEGEQTAATASPASPQGEGAGEGSGAELQALVSEVEGVLSKLKALIGGNGQSENGQQEGAQDTIKGLATQSSERGAAPCADTGAPAGNPKASPGPAAGVHAEAGDAALSVFYADLAAKAGLYDRVSKVVGAFDHAAMDARKVAVYGVKKLGIKCADGQEMTALTAYLDGREKAEKDVLGRVQSRAQDAAAPQTATEVSAWIKG